VKVQQLQTQVHSNNFDSNPESVSTNFPKLVPNQSQWSAKVSHKPQSTICKVFDGNFENILKDIPRDTTQVLISPH